MDFLRNLRELYVADTRREKVFLRTLWTGLGALGVEEPGVVLFVYPLSSELEWGGMVYLREHGDCNTRTREFAEA